MNPVLLGNLFSLAGSLMMVSIGFLKKRENVLGAQCFQFSLMGIGNLILGGMTGALSNFIGLIRNLICYKAGITVPLKIFFILLQSGLSLYVNNKGLIGLLPVAAAVIFTWFMDIKSDMGMKILLISTQCMWIIYDFTVLNYVAVVFDILFLCSNCVGIYRIRKSQ